jgi:hypothetical protein
MPLLLSHNQRCSPRARSSFRWPGLAARWKSPRLIGLRVCLNGADRRITQVHQAQKIEHLRSFETVLGVQLVDSFVDGSFELSLILLFFFLFKPMSPTSDLMEANA